jgi:hypothetical protein
MLYITSERKIARFSIMSIVSKKCGKGNAGAHFIVLRKNKVPK